MAVRRTRRAGLAKPRIEDAHLRQAFDGIIERIEVLDGIRGDILDKAVTWRDLDDSGFTIKNLGTGGGPTVINTPGPGDGTPGPTTGPAGPPTDLVASETFLAILLTWTNPASNLQFVEVWRNPVDNLSTAVRIGTSRAPLYLDYVGAEASYYYWVRSVGTDGSYSAFNDTAGTLGTTGVDPSSWEDNINVSADMLDALLAARIDLIDNPTTGLVDRMNAAEGDIVSLDSRTTTLESDYTTLQTDVSGNSALISANASSITTNQTNITSLLSSVGVLQTDVANNTAAITANANSVAALEATIGALDAEGGQEWDFTATADGWTANNATLTTAATTLIIDQTAADPQFISPSFSLTGGLYTQVVARVRQNYAGGGWEGAVRYTTSSHGFSNSYYKSIPDPQLALGEFAILTWDMTNLTQGGTDWLDSTVTDIRIDFGSTGAGRWEVDWVIIAKVSTTAISSAIDALDVRVTANEGTISSQATQLTSLESSVTDLETDTTTNAAAIAALTTDVTSNDDDIAANAAAITALEVGTVAANASAISILQADVTTLDGTTTSQASSITQLVSQLSGGFSSVVNPFTTAGQGFGSTVSDAEVQTYNVGGRTGVAARITTSGDVLHRIQRSNSERLYVDPYGIYEIKARVYHNRLTNAGSFYFGLIAYLADSGGSRQTVSQITNGVVASSTIYPYWFSARSAVGSSQWLDITCYLLGDSVDLSRCPDIVVNGSSTNTAGYQIFYDGLQTSASAPWVEFVFLNYNSSPTYGDDTTTTVFFTNFTVQRIDTPAEFQAILQEETSVLTSSVGDINATYAVKAELNVGGDPYVSGFGLMANVINGTASSAFGVRADKFFINDPNNPTDTAFPFVVDVVDGASTVGIRGELIVDGTIRGDSIVARDIGAGKITVTSLDTLNANMGVLIAGTLTTAGIQDPAEMWYDPPDNTIPKYIPDNRDGAWRIEIEGGSAWPLWYGEGAKDSTGLFYVTNDGDVVVKGLLDAGMIRQSYFTPVTNNNDSFRIAVDYPNNYSAGVYTGKKAHLCPIESATVQSTATYGYRIAPSPTYPGYQYGDIITFLGPNNSSTTEYSRLGTYSEMLIIMWSVTGERLQGSGSRTSASRLDVSLQYKYDTENWYTAIKTVVGPNNGCTWFQNFVTRNTSWDQLQFRVYVTTPEAGWPWYANWGVRQISLCAWTPNFGYADATAILQPPAGNDIEDSPRYPQYGGIEP